ncbi:ABC transporter ATP-binding protein [Stieleria marina]|uniref:ABC transporter ATP-binding protein YtrE n=1 Tax=Stieleria marina TaxID=1930275 RepID=A0A517NTN3_9BACT|nr:ABC transporter ATP-binding protein YtrE [Planctomycetes bacterium K23_9]
MISSDATSDDPLIRLNHVSRVYPRKSVSVIALRDISLTIQRGQRVAMLGRSGSGKSTLLNLLSGIDRPTSGSIIVDGDDIAAHSSDQLARYRMSSVGVVFQAFHLIPTLTATKNVELPFVFAGTPRKQRLASAMSALEAVGLANRASHRPSELSGGEQQRVALARALSHQPKLLLADEPTGNLDSTTASDIIQHLVDYSNTRNATVVLVTHDEKLASDFATRTIRLHDGHLIDDTMGAGQ